MPIPEGEIPTLIALRDAYGITVGEARVLALLAQGGIVPLIRLRDVYCDKPETDPLDARHCIKRIRKKTPNLRIITHYAIGYELDTDAIMEVRSVISRGRKQYSEAA